MASALLVFLIIIFFHLAQIIIFWGPVAITSSSAIWFWSRAPRIGRLSSSLIFTMMCVWGDFTSPHHALSGARKQPIGSKWHVWTADSPKNTNNNWLAVKLTQKGLASYCKAETTFTFHFSILTLSNAFLGIDNREMKSESGFSFAIASQPLRYILHLFSWNLIVWRSDSWSNLLANLNNLEEWWNKLSKATFNKTSKKLSNKPLIRHSKSPAKELLSAISHPPHPFASPIRIQLLSYVHKFEPVQSLL